MSEKKSQLDMTKGSILKNTLLFAIPLIFESLLQLLYNTADIVIVSRYENSGAMASVGAASTIYTLLINVFIGFSLSANVVVSRKFGAHDEKGVNKAVHTSVLLGIIVGLIGGVIGFAFSRNFLLMLNTPPEVLPGSDLYMKIIFLGVPASLVYNFGAAILRGVGNTKRPLLILSVSGVIKLLLNFIFVAFFSWSVKGVAVATVISNIISATAVIYTLVKSKGAIRLDLKKLKIHKEELSQLLIIGVPAGVQASFFSLSNAILQSAVNSYGEAAIAGNTAAGNIESFAYVIMTALHQTTLTGVSQNYGAKNEKRIMKTFWFELLCVISVGLLMGGICYVFADGLLGIYIKDSALAIEHGKSRILVTCLTFFLCGIMEVTTGTLRGLGYSVVTAVTAFMGTCAFRIFWVLVILERLPEGLGSLYLCWPASWILVDVLNIIILALLKPKAMRHMRLN